MIFEHLSIFNIYLTLLYLSFFLSYHLSFIYYVYHSSLFFSGCKLDIGCIKIIFPHSQTWHSHKYEYCFHYNQYIIHGHILKILTKTHVLGEMSIHNDSHIFTYTWQGQCKSSFPFCHQTTLPSWKSGPGVFSLVSPFVSTPQWYPPFPLLTNLQTCPLLHPCVLVPFPISGMPIYGVPPLPTMQTTQHSVAHQ